MRYIKLLFVIVLFSWAVFSQSITVNLSPQQDTYTAGDSVRISWTYSGIPEDASVKITLWREGETQSLCRITENFPVTRGIYIWRVSSTCVNPHTGRTEDLSQGRLKVRVRWQGHRPAVYGESDYFNITIPQPSITNVRLNPSRRSYEVGEGFYIKWDYSNIPLDARVKITLRREGVEESYCLIKSGLSVRSGATQWLIPEECSDPRTGESRKLEGGRYKIRVRWQGHRPAVYGESPYFDIPEKKVEIIYPSQYKTFYVGDVVPITWKVQGFVSPDRQSSVYIYLIGDEFVCRIAERLPLDRGVFNWRIPGSCSGRKIVSSVYKIKVSAAENVKSYRTIGIRTYNMVIPRPQLKSVPGGAEVDSRMLFVFIDQVHISWKLVVTVHYIGATRMPGLPAPSGRKNVPIRVYLDDLPSWISVSRMPLSVNISPNESRTVEFLMTARHAGERIPLKVRVIHSPSGILITERTFSYLYVYNK